MHAAHHLLEGKGARGVAQIAQRHAGSTANQARRLARLAPPAPERRPWSSARRLLTGDGSLALEECRAASRSPRTGALRACRCDHAVGRARAREVVAGRTVERRIARAPGVVVDAELLDAAHGLRRAARRAHPAARAGRARRSVTARSAVATGFGGRRVGRSGIALATRDETLVDRREARDGADAERERERRRASTRRDPTSCQGCSPRRHLFMYDSMAWPSLPLRSSRSRDARRRPRRTGLRRHRARSDRTSSSCGSDAAAWPTCGSRCAAADSVSASTSP